MPALRLSAILLLSVVLICFSFLKISDSHAAENLSRTLAVGGGTIDVTLPDGKLAVSQDDLMEWVKRAAEAVTTYYGRYPVKHLTLRISADDQDGVHHGVTYPEGGGLIVISVGRATPKADLQTDWMLTHEMIHLALPSMPRRQHWIEEGISVYVEPVARVQAGQLAVEEMWYETLRDMHQGEPEADALLRGGIQAQRSLIGQDRRGRFAQRIVKVGQLLGQHGAVGGLIQIFEQYGYFSHARTMHKREICQPQAGPFIKRIMGAGKLRMQLRQRLIERTVQRVADDGGLP